MATLFSISVSSSTRVLISFYKYVVFISVIFEHIIHQSIILWYFVFFQGHYYCLILDVCTIFLSQVKYLSVFLSCQKSASNIIDLLFFYSLLYLVNNPYYFPLSGGFFHSGWFLLLLSMLGHELRSLCSLQVFNHWGTTQVLKLGYEFKISLYF